MKFNNRKNECVIADDGRELWLSRSVAVAVTVIVEVDAKPYVLINQRGPGVPDGQGLWNMPCGYLDYDETLGEAAVREVWEECGVNVLELREGALFDAIETPWDINSAPTYGKQNVTTYHGLATRVQTLPALTDAYNEPGETTAIHWVRLTELGSYPFAFNHRQHIDKFVRHVASATGVDFKA